MNAKLFLTVLSIVALLVTGCDRAASVGGKSNSESSQPVNVGDTQRQVDKVLGEPSIEFPEGNKMIRWYADYEVTISNNVVVAVISTSTET